MIIDYIVGFCVNIFVGDEFCRGVDGKLEKSYDKSVLNLMLV